MLLSHLHSTCLLRSDDPGQQQRAQRDTEAQRGLHPLEHHREDCRADHSQREPTLPGELAYRSEEVHLQLKMIPESGSSK